MIEKNLQYQEGDGILCVYHAHCMDGFSAAYIVHKFFEMSDNDVEFIAAKYGDDAISAEKIANRHVLMVDFSYKFEQMLHVARHASSFTVIDHHKTFREELLKSEDCKGRDGDLPARFNSCIQLASENGRALLVDAIFDMHECGTSLVHKTLYGNVQEDPNYLPLWVSLIKQRDLWLSPRENADAFHEALLCEPQTFENWDRIVRNDTIVQGLLKIGRGIVTYKHRAITDMLYSAVVLSIPDEEIAHFVPALNVQPIWASDTGHMLLNTYVHLPFAATFHIEPVDNTTLRKQVKFSLRSENARYDVSRVAKFWGGGGHRNAAGFTVGMDVFEKMMQGGDPGNIWGEKYREYP